MKFSISRRLSLRRVLFPFVLGIAACGSVGPIGAKRNHVEVPAGGSSGYVPMPSSAPTTNWSDVNERARANQAAGQTGHCPLHNPSCR